MKNLLLTMLGLMAFVSVLFAGDDKTLAEMKIEKDADPIFAFYIKYPEIKNEFKDGYLKCADDNTNPAMLRKIGYNMRELELHAIAEGNAKYGKLLVREFEIAAFYYLKASFSSISEKQAKKIMQEAYKDCNSISECGAKSRKQYLIFETDLDYCQSKFNYEIFKDPNFMEKGTKWGDLYEDFKAEREMKKLKERFK